MSKDTVTVAKQTDLLTPSGRSSPRRWTQSARIASSLFGESVSIVSTISPTADIEE